MTRLLLSCQGGTTQYFKISASASKSTFYQLLCSVDPCNTLRIQQEPIMPSCDVTRRTPSLSTVASLRGVGWTTPGDTLQSGDTRMEKNLCLNLLVSDRCANSWNYRCQMSKKWHARWPIPISYATEPASSLAAVICLIIRVTSDNRLHNNWDRIACWLYSRPWCLIWRSPGQL